MGLINPKPRFGYDDATDQIYDYQKQRDVPLGVYSTSDGVWDLTQVKRLILTGQSIEAARVGPPEETKTPTPPPPAPSLPAGTQAENPPGPTTGQLDIRRSVSGPTGFSVEQ